ncbi:hypothetical protein BKP35_16700 [Anaerobacillus arseniciselenatis]|uniref:GmrSD restriction endonucleases N-terminal domain-containing protein n=1 Tax=Anaerobacillus arseniciselenatis TaxID=85682 RepID=A0A1S2LAN0_9BACI|nr:DUF262 domain-containing protein [Anaerobacillus arseniciselenatis]OIJ09310.1 hypothetical protein BKP35_16700 [Anaerobacillus arseniciselenatis]
MQQPEPQSINFSTLLTDIKKGLIKIPQFQREFVWSLEQSAQLLDSIVKGYPIGSFILWETKEQLRFIRNLGGAILPYTPEGHSTQYVLDGQQRMTTLFACFEGLRINRNNREEDFSKIYIDLEAEVENDEPLVIIDIEGREESELITLQDLLFGGRKIYRNYDEKYDEKLDNYKERFQSYRFSTILLRDVPIDVATEVFTRLNVGGKSLSVYEIMVAKTFDPSRDFDLEKKYKQLTEIFEEIEYDTVSASTILQSVAVILTKECTKSVILKIPKSDFISNWKEAIEAIKSAIDYFRNFYRIPVSRILPYNGLIVPFAYFFFYYKHRPSGKIADYLQDFFWRTSLSERYSSSLETRISQDIRRIDQILNGEYPKYDYRVNIDPKEIIDNGWFSVGRSYIKAILCLYAFQQPKSFMDNSIVSMNNNWLKQANSRNYHHFFPRAFLKKRGEEEVRINNVLNITIVDDYLNKRKIAATAPSDYMNQFRKENPQLEDTMKTHLIDNIDEYGIWTDDYNTFFTKRAEKVSEELKRRLIL